MKITTETLNQIADLAMINYSGNELLKLSSEFEDIIAFADEISQVDTQGIEPTEYILNATNVLRDDVVMPSLDSDTLFSNAPEKHAGCFTVPKIVE